MNSQQRSPLRDEDDDDTLPIDLPARGHRPLDDDDDDEDIKDPGQTGDPLAPPRPRKTRGH
ncbi:MAG: hypothetical protein ABIP61_01805 [Burkholderiaceae bacterium]